MSTILLTIFIVFTLFLFVTNTIEMKKAPINKISENMRVNLYKNALLFGLVSLLLVALLIVFTDIDPQDILLTQPAFNDNLYVKVIIYGATLTALLLSGYRMIAYMLSKQARIKTTDEIIRQTKSSAHYESFLANVMLPKSKREKMWFTLVSISAGISEEIVWRGLLIFLLQQTFPELSLYLILIIASLLFGIGHSYQGLVGILKTALGGLLLASIFVLTGNLLLSIILHFVLDFTNNFLYDDSLAE